MQFVLSVTCTRAVTTFVSGHLMTTLVISGFTVNQSSTVQPRHFGFAVFLAFWAVFIDVRKRQNVYILVIQVSDAIYYS